MLSIWEKESFFAPKDVIIIGSGFVGLWTAYYIKKRFPKKTVTILEKGMIPTGASTRNAGFACFGSLTELMDDAAQAGIDKTLELVEMRFKGLERIQQVFKSSVIDFKLTGGYDLVDATMNLGREELEEQAHAMNIVLKAQLGLKTVYQLVDKNIRKFGFGEVVHMVKNRHEGALHSGKLSQALLSLVQGMGVQVLNTISVDRYQELEGKVVLYSDKGIEFTASQVVACTNAFASLLFPGIDVVPARGQVLLTSPIDGLRLKGCFHYDHGYYYFRNLGNRVLLGGARNKDFERERTTEFGISSFIQEELERFLSTVILPGQNYQVTDRWSGIMAMGSEKMPILKKFSDNIIVAVRMSGMGVALAPVIGDTVASLID
ncbi:MAG TPA: FAD-binding oxidoreductase [Flavitalea sp.]|nr:FAD-binding oxidoreductase [Flavitalea sp.]